MNRFLICSLSLVILSGCATVNQGGVFHDQVFDAGPPSLVEFLPAGDKPIHIGGNVRGGRRRVDFRPGDRNPRAPLAYGWKFNLTQLPSKGGQLIISIYSLGPGSGCPTTVYVNGKRVKDLSRLRYAGQWVTTIANLSLAKEYFHVGLNQLVISEGPCQHGFYPGGRSTPILYNDSLIKSVLLVIL